MSRRDKHRKPLHSKKTCSKKRYKTAKEAYETQRATGNSYLRAYACPYCLGYYHLGRPKGD